MEKNKQGRSYALSLPTTPGPANDYEFRKNNYKYQFYQSLLMTYSKKFKKAVENAAIKDS